MLAFSHGGTPEIVEHGINGFLVQGENEMAEMVESAAAIDPMRSRQTAAERAPDRVAAAYEAVYGDVLERQLGRRGGPQRVPARA